MIPLERQRSILRQLEQQPSVSIADLVQELDVSHMTVRRDIRRLEELGKVISVPGGVSRPERLALDLSHEVKEGLQPAAKQAIARKAAGQVQPGNVVFLDAGTTTLAIARELAEVPQLVIVTNDLAIALAVCESGNSQLYFVGGSVDKSNQSSQGSTAAAQIAQFNVDVAFVSTSSFDLRGISVPSDAKQAVKKAIRAGAVRTILASDSSKYGRVASLQALKLTDFDAIICDDELPESAAEGIRDLGVSLVLANEHPQH